MSDLTSLIAQLSGSSQQAAADPPMAAVRLARASIDALMLKLGQTIDAKVVGPLPAGLTQLSAGQENLALKLATPLPAGAAVIIRVTATPQGTPSVTVSMPNAAPQVAQPLPLPAPTTPLVQAQGGLQMAKAPEIAQAPMAPVTQPMSLPASTSQPQHPAARTAVAPSLASSPDPAPPATASAATPVVVAQPAGVPVAAGPSSPQLQPAALAQSAPTIPPPAMPVAAAPMPGPAAIHPVPPSGPAGLPGPGQPAAQVTLPVMPAPVLPIPAGSAAPPPSVPPGNLAPASPATPTLTPVVTASPVAAALPATPAASSLPQPAPAPLLATPLTAMPVQPLPTHASPYPVQLPHADPAVVARQLPLAASTTAATAAATAARTVAPLLNLAAPAQAAARQDSAAPLLARLAAIVTAAVPGLPRPLLEAAQKVLSSRVDLNRTVPDGKALETAVLRSGVLLASSTRQTPGDSRAALLTLRSGLAGLLGSEATAPVAPVTRVTRPAPPLRGEPPRAPEPQPPAAGTIADGDETVRTLLGQTDAALSRLKLLQSASQPPVDARPDAPAPRSELRVEIPMLLGTQTGILQLLVERDGKQKREQRERGWRMRFAMNFSETGEVGADIAMLGRSASVSIWAADPDVAEALEAMLPELAPAIERHGLDLASLRVKRGAPRSTPATPGQLLDSAR